MRIFEILIYKYMPYGGLYKEGKKEEERSLGNLRKP